MKYFFLLLLVFALIFTVTRCGKANSSFGGTTENNADIVAKAKPDKPGASLWEVTGCSYGNWTCFGPFTTDDKGHGDFQIKILKDEMPAGEYNFSVWINDAVAGGTLPVSDNFTVTIAGGVVI